MLEQRTVLLDTRWLGLGGAGRATSLLLEGLRLLRPPGHWILWGPEAAQSHLWEGASWESGPPPTSLLGQRGLMRMPSHDVAIYMHQIRPLRRGPSLTLIHDTIPLRHGSSAPVRLLKRVYLKAVAGRSERIITVSEFSRRSITRDLGVDDSRIQVVRYPIDHETAARVSALRRSTRQEPLVLYVGRFVAHKNLERLLEAFSLTDFRNDGGRLLLVGGTASEVIRLRKHVSASGNAIEIRGSCTEPELEGLYARARLLIMPSLEEGFGLPVWEAMSCGLPVAVSDGGALPDVVGNRAQPFSATSVAAMAEAIDRGVGQRPFAALEGPPLEDFARRFVVIASEVARSAAPAE